MSTAHEAVRELIRRHFSGGLAADDEGRLRGHLPVCEECRQLYEQHQMAERLDPAAPSPRERLALALGLPVGATSGGRRGMAWALAGFAVAGVALFVMARSHRNDAFATRGADIRQAAAVDLAVFRIDRQGESTRVTDVVSADDELAFAYRNEIGKAFLMIFAVDGQNQVIWYHPAWAETAENPRAVAITKQLGFKELPEAVRQRILGPRLTVHALFMDTALDARAVERRVVGGVFVADGAAGEILRKLELRVRP
jgi:hypothetical protein